MHDSKFSVNIAINAKKNTTVAKTVGENVRLMISHASSLLTHSRVNDVGTH